MSLNATFTPSSPPSLLYDVSIVVSKIIPTMQRSNHAIRLVQGRWTWRTSSILQCARKGFYPKWDCDKLALCLIFC